MVQLIKSVGIRVTKGEDGGSRKLLILDLERNNNLLIIRS